MKHIDATYVKGKEHGTMHYPRKFQIGRWSLIIINYVNAEVLLPGMQPKEDGIEFAKVDQCRMCHAGTQSNEADTFLSWQSL